MVRHIEGCCAFCCVYVGQNVRCAGGFPWDEQDHVHTVEMIDFAHYFFLSVPLFGLVLLGYFIASWRDWRAHWTQYASWLVLSLVIPAMLFHMMSNRGALPAVDARLLIAFFGGCLLVFAIGRFIAESAGIAERSWAPWYPGEKDV